MCFNLKCAAFWANLLCGAINFAHIALDLEAYSQGVDAEDLVELG